MRGTCLLCEELFDDPAEVVIPTNGGDAFAHQACIVRSIAGGLNHLRGTCFCCGGTDDPDPPGLTKRQAAKVAFIYYRALQDGLRPDE